MHQILLTTNVQASFNNVQQQPSVALETSISSDSFSLSNKKRVYMMSSFCLSLQTLLFSLLLEQKIIKHIIVLEIYDTHDIIDSNLMLIILTLYNTCIGFQCNIECEKIPRWSKLVMLKLCNVDYCS